MRGKQIRVACLGASLTAGYNNRGTKFYPYAERIAHHFSKDDPSSTLSNDYEIVASAFGVCGEVTEEIAARGLQTLFKGPDSTWDTLVFLGGTNDLAYEVTPAQLVRNILSIAKVALSRNVQVFVMSIPPVGTRLFDPELHQRQLEMNEAIHKACDENSLHFVDLFKVLVDKDGETLQPAFADVDALHLSMSGYDTMARVVAQALKQWLMESHAGN